MIHGITPAGKLETKDANIAEHWKTYKQRWKNYTVIANLAAQTVEHRIALFLHCINGFAFHCETDWKSLQKIMDKFDQHTIGELNETYE